MELRHRQHVRVEDRIREAKATGLRNLPCRGFAENAAWLQAVLVAVLRPEVCRAQSTAKYAARDESSIPFRAALPFAFVAIVVSTSSSRTAIGHPKDQSNCID